MNLNVINLSFSYSTLPVIKDLSLEVCSGEFVSLIGPSGSGKSTLLMIIGGLLDPQQGEIWLNGRNTSGQRGLIGYVPQQLSLFPWYTVVENIALAQKLNKKSDYKEIEQLLVKADLEKVSHYYPDQLSGGMQQRVAFARALASNKPFLCLDEPFGALDAITRSRMQKWLISFLKLENRTILFITHSIEEAMMLSDRIYVLSHKPMTVKEEKVVSFPRDKRFQLRGTPEWLKLQMQIEGLI